ncbi:MAG: 30S ribosomal protein S20 [Clostridia bacterium]|nr:30S ribosomal protein S20 [Clostridia bacterium]MBQ4542855.1 30S ribosomal protein S20 [Clostridia bacterium]MBQ7076418.1 30S ribosomal protein S20 [Clostridia bacterium]
MPNIKSAKKRVKVINTKTLRNQMLKSELKTYIKKFELLVENGNKDEVLDAYKTAVKKLDQAISKGIMHKNTGARKKSQLTVKLNKVA